MSTARLIAVLLLKGGAPLVLERGDAMYQKVNGNTYLTNLNPTAAVFKTHLDTLRATQSVKGNGPPAVSARNDALKQVKADMENIRISVQQAADGTPALAETIITSAGLFVKKAAVRVKQDIAVVHGLVSGSVIVRVKSRGRGTTYFWVFGVDQKSWSSAPTTRLAMTTIADLTPGTTYYFRFQALTKEGLSDWSQTVSIVVT